MPRLPSRTWTASPSSQLGRLDLQSSGWTGAATVRHHAVGGEVVHETQFLAAQGAVKTGSNR
jgi:hypothetical protein